MGGGRGKGQGKGKGKGRRSLEEDPVACEKKMVNCLRHGSLGLLARCRPPGPARCLGAGLSGRP